MRGLVDLGVLDDVERLCGRGGGDDGELTVMRSELPASPKRSSQPSCRQGRTHTTGALHGNAGDAGNALEADVLERLPALPLGAVLDRSRDGDVGSLCASTSGVRVGSIVDLDLWVREWMSGVGVGRVSNRKKR